MEIMDRRRRSRLIFLLLLLLRKDILLFITWTSAHIKVGAVDDRIDSSQLGHGKYVWQPGQRNPPTVWLVEASVHWTRYVPVLAQRYVTILWSASHSTK